MRFLFASAKATQALLGPRYFCGWRTRFMVDQCRCSADVASATVERLLSSVGASGSLTDEAHDPSSELPTLVPLSSGPALAFVCVGFCLRAGRGGAADDGRRKRPHQAGG